MAVYTHVSREELEEFLACYDLGVLKSYDGIPRGVSNTNYHVLTDSGRYILTLFEKRRVNYDDLPFFFAFTDHLIEKGFACPKALPARSGETINMLNGRAAVLVSFLKGRDLIESEITRDICHLFGAYVAGLHNAADGFDQTRPNTMGLNEWKEIAAQVAPLAENYESGMNDFISSEIACLTENWPPDLPRGAVHTDLFPDNVFFQDGKPCGVIDFYFACTEFFAYDLAIVVNAWCFDTQNRFNPARFKMLMTGYESVRKLHDAERRALPLLCRAAAFRITVTRLQEYLFRDPESLMTPKDPGEYIAKTRYYQNNELFEPAE